MKLELNKRDRICFLGDSLVQNGSWIAEVFEYFKENYSELEIGFYNCGIGGTRVIEANLKNRAYCDCFNLFPKYTIIMFGMNDIGRHLYESDEEWNLEERKQRLIQYEDGLKNLIQMCEKVGTIPIICSPTPYDEYNKTERAITTGLDKALQKYIIKIAKRIADEKGLLFIDMHSPLLKHMDEIPIGPDRVHPNAYGYHLMAEYFLCAIGAKENPEPEKIVELQGKSKKRFQTEEKLRTILFIERHLMGWQRNEENYILERRKELVRQRIEIEQNAGFRGALSKYLENADFKEELRGDLIKQTLEMYQMK